MGNFGCSHDFIKRFEVTSQWPLTVMKYREVLTREVSEEVYFILFEDAVSTAGGKGMTNYKFCGSAECHDTTSEQLSKCT